MEVLRRLRLPDAKSVIPKKFGPGPNPLRKEREILPSQPSEAAANPPNDGDAEAGSKAGEAKEAESQRLVPRKGRGRQPIAPKPDENAAVLPGGQQQRPKGPKATSSPRSAPPTSTRSRRAAKGRAPKRSGQPPKAGREGAAHAAQDPPGNVQRNQSIVASQAQQGGSPISSESSSPPRAPPASINAKRNGVSSANNTGKGANAPAKEIKQCTLPGAPSVMKRGDVASPLSDTPKPPLETRPVGRGPLGAQRRPTPAPYVLQSPSGVDAKKANAAVAVSSLLDAGGGIIGELDEEEGAAAAAEDAIVSADDEQLLMNLETPRTRNGATVVGADALNDGAGLPAYPDHNSSSNLDSSQADGGVDDHGDDEASLPGPPQALGTAVVKSTNYDRHQPNPNDSTTSLGRQSTTSAAVRRRGRSRSHSRTRQPRSDPVRTTVSVERGGSNCPNSPSRRVTRSRSQRRQRRSRSRSSSRTRSHSADVSAGDASASPVSGTSSTSPRDSATDAARLSPGGRRPQRAPPVTKRTHAQKMSMKNAIKAADLDIMTPSPSIQAATLTVPLETGSDSSTMAATPSSARPNGALATSPAAAVTTLAETARWKAPENGGPSAREPRTRPASTPPTAAVALRPSEGNDDDAEDAADASSSPPKRSNPVRALTHGLLKRRPSFGGAGGGTGLLRFGGGATASPTAAAGAASASASASDLAAASPEAE